MIGSLIAAIVWMSSPVPLGPGASLRWIQDASATTCIGERELAAAVTARLGDKAAARGGTPGIVIAGTISASASGWNAEIDTTDAHGAVLGQRALREPASDCRAMDDKLALVIALIIDPELLEQPDARIAARREPEVAPRAPWRFGAGVSALAARGLMPGFGFGTALSVMIEPPHGWPIEIDATLWPHDRERAGPGGATLLQLTGGAALCPPIVALASVCFGAQAGELRARGVGYDQNELRHELVVDATAELRLDWRLHRTVNARLGAGAWVPLSRPRFVFRQAGTDVLVYQPAIAALVTEIALWVTF